MVIKKFPNTDYVLTKFKLGLIDDILASKEMYIKILFSKKWIAAINRFRKVIDEYDTTIYAKAIQTCGSSLQNWSYRGGQKICHAIRL